MRRMTVLFVALAMVGVVALPVSAGGANQQDAVAIGSFPWVADTIEGGTATLTRSDSGITTRAKLTGAEPGVYTMWWVVWNTPEECGTAYACTETDLVDPDVDLSIGYAGGAVVGENGKLNTSAHLNVGSTLTGFPDFGLPLVDSMVDSRHAEIHLVWRYHGPKVPGLVDEALQTFDGVVGEAPEYDYYFAVFASEDA